MTSLNQHYTHEPLRLKRNIRYPTYQLFAIAGSGKLPADQVLIIAILETLLWLRKRFLDFNIPSELKWPDPENYTKIDLSMLTSFRIDTGYKVDVVWLPEEHIWALQLTEPDSGTSETSRPPVPGRLFETNIAFRQVSNRVECGFLTIVSDPEGSEIPCEVFRLAVVKKLARNPLVGLKQGFALVDQAHTLECVQDIKRLQEWLKDPGRMMPAVIHMPRGGQMQAAQSILYVAPVSPFKDIFQGVTKEYVVGPRHFRERSLEPSLPQETQPVKADEGFQRLARYHMGYAQFFLIPPQLRDAFQKISLHTLQEGDLLLIEPAAFGGDYTRYRSSQISANPEAIYEDTKTWVENYGKGKPVTFGTVCFLSAAKEKEQERLISLYTSKQDLLRAFEEKSRAMQLRYEDEMRNKDETIALWQRKTERLIANLDQANEDKMSFQERFCQLEQECEARLKEKDREVAWLQSRLAYPQKPCDVWEWVKNTFDGRLMFHPRAKNLMDQVPAGSVDLDLLCAAIEYLATEYLDEICGIITPEERDLICAKRYNRPFEVTPVRGVSTEAYAKEYTITYVDEKGAPTDCKLDLHLKVGRSAENLLRIYFLYDKHRKLIVVGSLPSHLSTRRYS